MTLSIHVSKISRKETSNSLLSILRIPLQLWEVAAPISHKYFTSFHSIPEPAELSLWGSIYLSSPSANRCRIVACPPPLFQPMHNSYTPSSLHTSLKYSMYLLGVIFRYPLCASQLFILICCAGVPSVFFQTSKARPLLRYSSLDPATLPLAVISHPRNRKAYAGAQVWQLILYGVSRFLS